MVEVALFLIDSLMHKLPETFSRALRKEGTVHAVRALRAALRRRDGGGRRGGQGDGREHRAASRLAIRWCPRGGPEGREHRREDGAAGKSGSGKKPSETPQRRAAVERASRARALASVAETEAESRLRTVRGPLRSAGDPARPPTSRWISSPRCWRARRVDVELSGVRRRRGAARALQRRGPARRRRVAAAARPELTRAAPRRCPERMGAPVERLLDALAVTESLPAAERRQGERRDGELEPERRRERRRGRPERARAAVQAPAQPRAGQARGSARLRVQHHPRRAPGDPQRHRGLPVPRKPRAPRRPTRASGRRRRRERRASLDAAKRRGSKETRRGGKRAGTRGRGGRGRRRGRDDRRGGDGG